MEKYKIVKISDLFKLESFNKDKDLDIFSNFIYRETIMMERLEELVFEGNIQDLYENINYLHRDYPNFEKWYFEKVAPNLINETREVLLCFRPCKEGSKNLKLAGLAILKKTENEKKICTFRVSEEYRGQQIAKDLFEKSFEVLGTRKPLITISQSRKNDFEKYIKMYNFECTGKKEGMYVKGKTEYIYNGRLD